MENTRKMVLMPAESVPTANPSSATQAPYFVSPQTQIPEHKEKRKFESPKDKMRKLYNIALKLALVNGYNGDLRILDDDGNIVPQTNIELLVNHALTHQKYLVGEDAFIRLLIKAGVDPEMIINENIKQKLIDKNKAVTEKRNIRTNAKTRIVRNTMPRAMETEPLEMVSRVPKRVRELEDGEESFRPEMVKKTRVEWEIPQATFPKMVIRKVKPPVKKNTDLKWVEPRNSNDESDVEIVSDNDDEEIDNNYDNSKFIMTPSRL